ncbi:MAG: DUF4136 domain-containing protein [Candidatus Latescibacteria bacterium]|nr:DUF4136 domain-containing protein [Candidatus Latescibacterota bacterium]
MRARVPHLMAALLTLCMACAPVSVRWDYDPEADFTQYKTFNWLPAGEGAEADQSNWDHPFVDKRIEQALITTLKGKGFEKTAAQPDLLVAYRFTVKQKTAVHLYDPPNPYWSPQPAQVQHLREGTLIIDLVDPSTRQLVWRGWGVGDYELATRPDLSREYLQRAVREIFKNYPPY